MIFSRRVAIIISPIDQRRGVLCQPGQEKQLQKMNENLDLALENMEIGLTEILQEYMNDDGNLDG